MKTSEFIGANAPKLHSLLDSCKSPTHNPELLTELEALVAYISDAAPATRESGDDLIELARRYYGAEANQIDDADQVGLARSMRLHVSFIATRSTTYARNGD